jgi:hypothetical protein
MIITGSRRSATAAFYVLGGFWAAAMAANLANVEVRPLAGWVPVAETTLLLGASIAAARSTNGARVGSASGAVAALMLMLFALVHIQNRGIVSGMIPGWLPAAWLWPYVTAATMAAAALAWAFRHGRTSFLVVAAMFLSWLPLVHGGRIAADPTSAFEWEFASMAVALAGALIVLARPERTSGVLCS